MLRESQQRRRSSAASAVGTSLSVPVKRTSFSVASMTSVTKMTTDFSKLFCLEKITSNLYGPSNPPMDWADITFLIPHEAIRREIAAMSKSITKLNDNGDSSSFEPWQAVYFCEWFVDHLLPAVLDHHHNEEVIYFPWVRTKVELPNKKLSDGHVELIAKLATIQTICETVIHKGGVDCTDELAELKDKMLELEKDMLDHLQEEETDIPPLLRANFTKEEEDPIIQKIGQSGGLGGIRLIFPCIVLAMKEWASPLFFDDFMATIPAPIRHLMDTYIVPDELNCVVPKRDAPFLSEKPALNRVKCCRVPFCCPCII